MIPFGSSKDYMRVIPLKKIHRRNYLIQRIEYILSRIEYIQGLLIHITGEKRFFSQHAGYL